MRLALLPAAALAVGLALPSDAAALDREDPSGGLRSGLVTERQRRAVDRAQEWIASRMQPGGFWGKADETRVADTALSVLALIAGGSTVGPAGRLDPGDDRSQARGDPQLRGPHARQVKEGIAYLARLGWSRRAGKMPGYIQDDDVSRMHGHGFATLALASACGNLGARDYDHIDADIKDGRSPTQLPYADQVRLGLEKAVRVIERAQDPATGGWYYEPVPESHEGSMTVTMILALRAAGDAGVRVSGLVMKRAYQYVRDSQNKSNRELYGGFAYMKTRKGRVTYALTAAALTTFFGLGRYGADQDDSDLIRDGMRYLDRNFDDALGADQWFYYGLFYGAQALYQEHDPRRLRNQWPRLRDTLIDLQKNDGSFPRVGHDGRSDEYCTAMGTLILEVPMESLPIFQRR